MDRQQLRDRVQQLYSQYRAICILAFANGEQRKQLDATLAEIPKLSRRKLEVLHRDVDSELNRLVREFDIEDPAEIEKAFAEGLSDPTRRGDVVLVRAHFYRQFMPGLVRDLPGFDSLPPHATISIDALPTPTPPRPEVFLLEASLFEDMAALYNGILDAPAFETPEEKYGDQVGLKRKLALQRATIRAAFAVLEAYLNGLASDILSDKGESLSHSQQVRLMEWDAEAKRHMTLSLRQKLLQYPMMAIGAEHPPLDDRSCAEVREVLRLERLHRHAVVHPTPQWNHENPKAIDRESIHHHVDLESVTQVCDAIVSLIKRVDETIGHRYGEIAPWLADRDEHGRYPPNTFK